MLWTVARSKHTVPTVVMNDGPVGGYNPRATGGEGDSWLLGVNWYPTNNTRVSAHWSAWSVDNRTGTFLGDDSGNTATVRVQTAF